MIKKDLFSLDTETLRIKYSRFLDTGTVFYCYICENAHIGCRYHCKRYNRKIKTEEKIYEINTSFIEICRLKLAELKGE